MVYLNFPICMHFSSGSCVQQWYPVHYLPFHLISSALFTCLQWRQKVNVTLTFNGPCIIVIVENKRPTWCYLLFLFHFLCAQHVSDINISIIRSLRLFCWITTLIVCSWLNVCWCFIVVGLASACNMDTTPTQPHRNINTHWAKNTRPIW